MRFLLILYGLITLEVFAKNRPQNDYLLTLYERHMKDAKQNGNSVHALLPSQLEDADDKTSTFHYNLSGLDRRDVITSLKLLININNHRPSTGQRAHLWRKRLAQTTSSSSSTFTSTSTSPPSTTSSTSTSSPSSSSTSISTTSSTSTSPPSKSSSTSTSSPSTSSTSISTTSSTSSPSTTSSTSTSPPFESSSTSTSPPSTSSTSPSSPSTSSTSTSTTSSTSPPSKSSSTSTTSSTSSPSTSSTSTATTSSTSPPSKSSSTSRSNSSAGRAARTGSPLLPLRARIHCLSHNTSTLVATVTVARALSQCWQTVELMPHFAQLCQSARQSVTLTLQLQQQQHQHQQHQHQRRASNGPHYRTVPRRFFSRHQVESYIVVITQDATATNLANKFKEIGRPGSRRRFVDVDNNATSQRKIHLSDHYDRMTDRAWAAHLSDLLRHSSARRYRRNSDTKHYHYYRVDNSNNNNNSSSSSSSSGGDDGREIVMTFKRFSQIEERNSKLRHSKKAHGASMPYIPHFNDQHSTKWRNRLLPHPKRYRENLMKLKRRIHKRKYRIHPKYVDISRRRHLQNNPESLRNERLPSSWVDPVMKKLESSVLPPGGDNCSLLTPSSCTRQSFVVDFFELGWTNWIISPLSFDAFICMGNCSMPMQKDTTLSNHATLQTLKATFEHIMNARTATAQSRAHSMSRDPASESALPAAIPTPACVADQMEPLTLLYYDCHHSHVILKTFPDMIISSCACR